MVCMCIHTHTIHIGDTHALLPSSRLYLYTSVLPLRAHICTTLQVGHTCTYHPPGRVHTSTYYHTIIVVEGGIHVCMCLMWRVCVSYMWRLSVCACVYPTWMVCVFCMEGAHSIYVCTCVVRGKWHVYLYACTCHPAGRTHAHTHQTPGRRHTCTHTCPQVGGGYVHVL